MCTILPSHAQATSTILIFGDSLTAGYRLQPQEALPAVVERRLKEQQKDVQVINGGVSGDTTSGGVRRLTWMLDRHQPDIVFLALGGNDMLRGVAPDMVRKNLDTMLAELQQRNIKTILMGVTVPPNQDASYSAAFNAVYPNLAKQYNVVLYPFFLESIFGHRDYMLDDGVHPNARGVEYIAEHLADYFLKTGWI
jgi:acyl-CoA thioesterase-1